MRRLSCLRLKTRPDRPGLASGGTCNFRPSAAKMFPALTGRTRIGDARQAAALDGEHLDRRGAPAQLRWSQCINDKIVSGTHQAEQIGGDEQGTADLLAMLLQPCRDVHGVAEIRDLSTRDPALTDHHRSRMHACAKNRYQAELRPVR